MNVAQNSLIYVKSKESVLTLNGTYDTMCSIVEFSYNSNYTVSVKEREELLSRLQNKNFIIINKYKTNSANQDLGKIEMTAKAVRDYIELSYGVRTDIAGRCIEASELIVEILKCLGFKTTKTVEGWCLFDNQDYGSDRPYDEHTWVEIKDIYIDVTADQFNVAMYADTEFKPIIIQKGLPHGMRYYEPEYNEEYEEYY
jgi:hypothetical protein